MLHFLYKKAVMKTCGSGKIPREDADLVQGARNPAGDDTTSELCARKCHTGCARYCVNEWLLRKQPGWNRGILK